MNSKIYKIILTLTVLYSCVFASTEKNLFQQAIEFYKNADYYSAEKKFIELETLLRQQGKISVEVYYNLGNCYFRQNKLGWARYYYELAKYVYPYNRDINFNLNYVKKILKIDNEENIIEYLLDFIHIKHLLLLTFIFNMLFFSSLILSNFLNTNITRWVKRVVGLFFIILVIFSVIKYSYYKQQKCIVVETTQILSAPEEELNVKSVVINEGKKAIILSKKDNYYAIYLLEDKVQGWIREDKVRIVLN